MQPIPAAPHSPPSGSQNPLPLFPTPPFSHLPPLQRSFPPPMDPRGAPYSSPSSRGGGWGNPPPGGMHSPPHRSRFDLPPSAAPDPYGSLSSLGSMGGADRYGSAMGGLGAGSGGGLGYSQQISQPPPPQQQQPPPPYQQQPYQQQQQQQQPGTQAGGGYGGAGGMGGAGGAAAGPGGGGMDASGQLRAALSKYGRETPAAAAAAAMTNTVSPVVTQVSVWSLNPPRQVSATMQIPLSYVDAIIGPNGTNIAFLRRTTGGVSATMQIPLSYVDAIIGPNGTNEVSATMQIPLSYVDAIIGPNGTNIVFLRRTSGAAVTIQESRGAGGQPEMTVEVRGSATQVQTAQQLIEPEMTVEVRGSATQVQMAQQLIEVEMTVEVRGSATQVQTAQQLIEAMARLSILPALLGVVLGLGGHMGQQEGGDPPSQGDERPSDDAILAQQNAMREEEAQRYPLVGEKEPLSALASEYAAGSTAFQDKIEHLASEYEAIRRTRGDGNCFFRCFLFALLEHLLQGSSKEECEQVRERVARSEQRLRDLGYTEFTWEDFAAEYRELLDAVDPSSAAEKITVDGLLKRCQDPDCSNYAVMFLRFITSADIQHRADFFHPFLPDAVAGMSAPKEAAKQFCHKAVEPMGEESDHMHITAITDALAVPIRIVYLDRSAGQANFHEFLPEESVRATPAMTLLYRPGHYDILYPKQK
ncbi:unnamed protein product [Closterium sp. NIES-64]|nr:unnamed protein product [Closterium sp. NIES-64]